MYCAYRNKEEGGRKERSEMPKRVVIEKCIVSLWTVLSWCLEYTESAILIGGHCAGNIIVLSGGELWKGEVIKKRKKKKEKSRKEENKVKKTRKEGERERQSKGRNKWEKGTKFVHEERTNDNNDEPNIDPVKPVRLPSLYSLPEPLSSTSFSSRASIFTLSFLFSLSLFLSLSRDRSLDTWIPPTTAALSWNALGTDDFFECGPKIAHGNNYCGGFLLKITDLWITNEKDQEWAGVYEKWGHRRTSPPYRQRWKGMTRVSVRSICNRGKLQNLAKIYIYIYLSISLWFFCLWSLDRSGRA